jgi:hypothetical protein
MQEVELVNVKTAAYHGRVSISMIGYMIRRGYVKRHPIKPGSRYYLVDLNEVLTELEKGAERKSKCYNLNWALQPRDRNGNFVKRSTEPSMIISI